MSYIQLRSDIPVELIQSMGGDVNVVQAARASTLGLASRDSAENFGIINFLMKHRHGTPFEHSALTILVHAPIFVWREWHRHRIGFSYNEESGRYKKLEPIFYVPSEQRKLIKVKDFKPGRPAFEPENPPGIVDNFKSRYGRIYELCYAEYERSFEDGVDNGLARICLPVAIYSACWVTCNPRSIMHFLSLRTHSPEAKFVSYPLQEIETPARALEEIFEHFWPLTYIAFQENGRVAP